MPKLPPLSPETVKAYQEDVAKRSSVATAKRKAISLNRFFDWAEGQGHIPQNPMSPNAPKDTTGPFLVQGPKKSKISKRVWAVTGITAGLAVLVFLLVGRVKLPIPFTLNFAQESKIQTGDNTQISPLPSGSPDSVPANSAVIAGWNLFAKLKLTSTDGTPEVGSQVMSFKIYNSASGGTPLYTSEPQSVTTDSDGSALISLPSVPADLYFQNEKLFLEPVIGDRALSERILIPTASVASNVNQYPAADPESGAGPGVIPVIDSTGALVLASESPALKAVEGNLLVEGQALVIKTADGSGGNIEINPDANGITHFLFEGNKGNFLNAQAPNLRSGSLYYGMVPNNATGYDLIKLQSGAPVMTTRFSVDALGNTYVGSDLNVAGDIATGGVDRLTSGGVLENITGYFQDSGYFVIQQGAGDFASITKEPVSGGALSSVLTLTLDERGKPVTANSSYSTLVLNRYDGDLYARALLVNNGDAQFNDDAYFYGQVKLGNFASDPTAIGSGSVYYNSTDNLIYYWDGSAWQSLGTAVTTPFSLISSGTNTTAAMVVGTGASLDYSGTGTINASTLNSIASTSFLRSDTSDNFTSGTLTTDAGTTLDINGDLVVSDTNISFDGASTTFTTTGDLTLNIGGGDLILTDTQTINIGGSGSDVVYNAIANSVAGASASMDGDNDLYIEGDLEVDGTIIATNLDASTLDGIDSTQFLRSDTSDNFTSGTLTTDAGTTFDVNGDLVVSDTNISFDGASTTFTTTGDLTLNIGGGDLILTDTQTINIGGSGSDVVYNAIGDSLAGASANMNSDNDLYIEGDLEVDGTIYGNVSGTINPGFTTGSVIFQGPSGLAQDNPNFFWNDTDDRLGLGTSDPRARLDVDGDASVSGSLVFYGATPTIDFLNDSTLTFQSSPGGDAGLTPIATLSPAGNLDINGTFTSGTSNGFQVDSNGRIVSIDGVAHTIDDVAGDLTLSSASTNISLNDGVTFASTTTLNGLTYTWPAAATAGEVLQVTGVGPYTLDWVDPTAAVESSVYWTQALGALYPKNNTVDVLIGSDSTVSAKFAFKNVLTGVPTASISGNITDVATFIDGNGNISSTNRNDLTLGNSSTYDSTGNILLNPNGTGNVGIGTALPTAKLDINDSTTTNGNVINATASGITTGNILNLAEGGDQGFTGNVIQADIDNTGGGGGAFTGNFLYFLRANALIFKVDYAGNIATAGNAAINGGSITTTSTTANLFNTNALTINFGGAASTINIGAPGSNVILAGDLAVNGDTITSDGELTIDATSKVIIPAGDTFETDDITSAGALTLTSTGANNITLDSGNGSVVLATDDDLMPTLGVGDANIGSLVTPWDNIYGTSIFQGGNQVCDTSGNCAAVGNYWRLIGEVLTPVQESYDLLIGGDATGSGTFQVYAATGNIVTSGDLAVNGDTITSDGELTIDATSKVIIPDADTFETNDVTAPAATALTITGNAASTWKTTAGDLTLSADAASVNINANEAAADQIKLSAAGAIAGNAINITTTDGGILLDANGAANGDLTFDSADDTTFNVTDVFDLNAATVNIDGSSAINIGTTTDVPIDIDSSTFSLDASGAITITTSGAGNDITLTSADQIILNSTGTIELQDATNITGNLSVSTGTITGANSEQILIGATNDLVQVVRGGITYEVCDSSGNCGAGDSFWRLIGEVLTPVQESYDLLIGGDATGSGTFQVYAATGNIVTSGDLEVNGGNITSTGALAVSAGTGAALSLTAGTAGAGEDLIITTDNISLTAAGAMTLSPDAGVLTAIDITDTDYTYALSLGDNDILGTTTIIDFNNFDLDAAGNIILAGTIDINGLTNDIAGTLNLSGGALTSTGALTITPQAGNDLNIVLSGTGDFVVNTDDLFVDTSSGFIGIGKTLPLYNLDVAGNASISGTLSLGPMYEEQAGTCDASTAGKQYYNGAENKFYYCNATIWTAMGSGAGGSKWKELDGAISPYSDTLDVLIGNSATASAKFAFQNILTGTPTLNVSAQATNIAIADNTANALQILQGSDQYFGITTTNDAEVFNINLPAGGATSLTANLFTSNIAKTINLGTGTAIDTINIGTGGTGADIINIGSANAGNVTVQSGAVLNLTGGANSIIDFPNFDVATTGNITTAGDAAINGGDITSTATTFNFDIGNTGTLNFRDGTNTLVKIIDQGTTGDLAISGVLQVGGLTPVGYSRFGTNTTTNTHLTDVASNVLISGKLELDDTLYLDGGTIANSAGTATIVFSSTPTTTANTLTGTNWLIENPALTGNVGQAALIVDQYKAGDLFTASAAGTTQFRMESNGDSTFGNTGTAKITVGTVDPAYTINGQKFATFLAGMVGVKEETAGNTQTTEHVPGVGYRSVIDFTNQPVGSDIWLFSKATNIGANIDDLVALLTPSDSTRVWYEIDEENHKIAIYSARPTSISYRLTAPRFDAQDHPNQRTDSVPGFVLNIPDIVNNNPVTTTIQTLAGFTIEKITDGIYRVKDSGGTIIDGVESIGNFVAGNIKSGAIQTQEIATNSFAAFQGTVDNLLISSGLVSPSVKTALISPIPGEKDVTLQIGSTEETGKLAVQNAAGSEVASIDSSGNATFSGTVKATNIDSIQDLLSQVQADQSVLSDIVNSGISTTSANLSELITSDLYVTNQAAISSLSVTNNLAVGNDLIFGSDNTINTLSQPLEIQSLAMAPIELMAGLVTIDTQGNVNIAGNLNVAGRIKSSGLTLTDNQNQDSEQLLTLRNDLGSNVATVDASGSANFNSVSAGQLFVAAPDAATPGQLVDGIITTDSTIGSVVIPAGTAEITIKNPKITDYTFVYTTPTSTTQNSVLYVKSKQAGQFIVGFDNPLPIDVSFNWWIVQASQ